MTDSTSSQPGTQKQPEESVRPKLTLSQFIDDNSKLVSSIAVFIALTAFASQMGDMGILVGGLSFLAALLLAVELLLKTLKPGEWRLEAFRNLLAGMLILMAAYWFSKFDVLWKLALVAFLPLLLVIVFAGSLAHALKWAIGIAATRIFNRKLSDDTMFRILQFGFILCASIAIVGLYWVSRKLPHPVFR